MGLASNAPVTLTIVTNVSDSNARTFSIKITQIDCLSFSRGIYFLHSYFVLRNVTDLIDRFVVNLDLCNCKFKAINKSINIVIKEDTSLFEYFKNKVIPH